MVGENAPSQEQLFLHLVTMFQVAAMQQLGKLVSPATGEVERDLDQAKFSIDILDMIKERTKGNLTDAERDFIDKVLFELHMNYVDESKASKDDATQAAPDAEEDATGDDTEEDKKTEE